MQAAKKRKMASIIKELYEKRVISATDFQIAGYLSGETKVSDPGSRESLELLAALVSQQAGAGSSCLTKQAYESFKEELKDYSKELSLSFDTDSLLPAWEDFQNLNKFTDLYTNDPFQEFKPIVFFMDRYYFYKYWYYENILAEKLCRIASESGAHSADFDKFSSVFDTLFDTDSVEQKRAAELSVKNRMTIITGGPGTGKTTIISKIILALLSIKPDAKILLAAPTGKAASRMNESLKFFISGVRKMPEKPISDDPLDLAATLEGCSLHRLLGWSHGEFLFNKNNKLSADLIIVDEASMVDISMMNALLDAIDGNSSLILLGDKDQLASVAVGNVLSDICASKSTVFKKNIAELTVSYRFDPAIKEIAEAVKAADADLLKSIAIDHKPSDREIEFTKTIKGKYGFLFENDSPAGILEKLGSFKILTTTNESVADINKLAEKAFGIDPAKDPWYNGRPVMVTKNNYGTGLFNGDCGVILECNGTKRAYFQGHSDEGFAISELGAVETVYAMTIHKSQGSEFISVLIFLPDDLNSSAMLTKEILYTAVTRAKKSVSIYASAKAVEKSITNENERSSSLKKLLEMKGDRA